MERWHLGGGGGGEGVVGVGSNIDKGSKGQRT